MRKRSIAVALGVLIVLWAAPAFAQVAAETCDPAELTETIGATTISFDSCLDFQVTDKAVDESIPVTVDWNVDAGFATFNNFVLKMKEGKGLGNKGYTPVSKRNKPENSSPALGTEPATMAVVDSGAAPSTGSVTFQVTFTDLHSGKNGEVEIGTGHYKLLLNVDEDADGVPDTVAKFGVNVHICVDIDAANGNQCLEDS